MNQQQDFQEIPLQTVESYWRRVFSKYDRDNDGRIPLRELVRSVQSSGFTHDIPAPCIKRLIHKFDDNNDGYISFSEFMVMVETSPEARSILDSIVKSYIHYTVPPRLIKKKSTITSVIDGEYEEQYSCNPPAVAMLIISIVEISMFVYDLFDPHNGKATGYTSALFIYNPYRRKEAWRFLTYMLVHVGTFHLVVNLLVQIMLGIPLEMVHGWWRVSVIYLAGVVAGSLATSLSDPHVYLAGASGGVYAIIAAHLATLIINWSEMQFAWIQLIIFVLLCTIDVGTAIYQRYVSHTIVQIGYVAHFAGSLAGLLVGIYVLRNLQVLSWEKKICWIALSVYFILMLISIAWNIFLPDYFPPQSI